MSFWNDKRVLVTGGHGFVGSYVVARLAGRAPASVVAPSHAEFDLTEQAAVRRMYGELQPDVVLHVAGASGGIGAHASNQGGDFYANMAMGLLLVEEGRRAGLTKFVQIGTADAYSPDTEVPFRESDLWNGPVHPAQKGYAVAKRSMSTMLETYAEQYGFPGVHVLLVNVFGPGSTFDLQKSQVIAAMIRKFQSAVDEGRGLVECWGTGRATRDFLFVEDVAEGLLLAAERATGPEPINLGSGREISVAELAETIARLVGYEGEIFWDPTKPEGALRRCLASERAHDELGFAPRVGLEEGLRRTVEWWRAHRNEP